MAKVLVMRSSFELDDTKTELVPYNTLQKFKINWKSKCIEETEQNQNAIHGTPIKSNTPFTSERVSATTVILTFKGTRFQLQIDRVVPPCIYVTSDPYLYKSDDNPPKECLEAFYAGVKVPKDAQPYACRMYASLPVTKANVREMDPDSETYAPDTLKQIYGTVGHIKRSWALQWDASVVASNSHCHIAGVAIDTANSTLGVEGDARRPSKDIGSIVTAKVYTTVEDSLEELKAKKITAALPIASLLHNDRASQLTNFVEDCMLVTIKTDTEDTDKKILSSLCVPACRYDDVMTKKICGELQTKPPDDITAITNDNIFDTWPFVRSALFGFSHSVLSGIGKSSKWKDTRFALVADIAVTASTSPGVLTRLCGCTTAHQVAHVALDNHWHWHFKWQYAAALCCFNEQNRGKLHMPFFKVVLDVTNLSDAFKGKIMPILDKETFEKVKKNYRVIDHHALIWANGDTESTENTTMYIVSEDATPPPNSPHVVIKKDLWVSHYSPRAFASRPTHYKYCVLPGAADPLEIPNTTQLLEMLTV